MNSQHLDLLLERNAELEKKLEVKNREMEIEAALERVRSRALAMHHSDELREVVTVVFETLQALDFALQKAAAIICIFTESSKDQIQWIADAGQSYAIPFNIPYHDNPLPSDIFNAKESGEGFFSRLYPFETKNEYFNFLFTNSDYKHVPDDVKKMILESRSYGFSIAFAKNSAILVPANTGTLLSENEANVLKRFANVFEQSYTRFLDLQRAEAQAREATIEAALERVRSRSMAMHKSTEVMDVAVTVYDELQKLDFKFGAATIIIMDEKTGNMEHWLAGFIQKNHVKSYQVNNSEHPLHAAQRAAWREGAKFVSIELSGFALKSYAKEMFTQSGYRNLPDEEKAMLSAQEHAVFNLAYMSHGALMWAPSAISDENAIILQRFAKVFEQTYTRFLDLQKAEELAREAQIELALEKVRTRAMAMQKSDELAEAAKLLYDELRMLNINPVTCGYVFINEEQQAQTVWVTLPDGTLLPDYIVFPLTGDLILSDRYKGWKQKEPLHKAILEGEVNKEHHRFLSSQVPANVSTEIFAHIPENIVFYSANFSAGYLMIIATELFSTEEEQIIVRFAKVFEITYTRFLDLQRAEAQAREAQIELGLERVRARAMAMQKSDELAELVDTVFKQLTKLGFALDRFLIMLYDEATNGSTWWLSGAPTGLFVAYNNYKPYDEYLKAWKERKSKWTYILAGNEKKEWDKYLFNETDLALLLDAVKNGMQSVERVYANVSFNSFSSLTFSTLVPLPDKEFDILLRFAKVFDQTYTRFLDLQRAEAQAREAKIEAALESVRASSMAMHHSEELEKVVKTLSNKLIDLGLSLDGALILFFEKEKRNIHLWIASNQLPAPIKIDIPYAEDIQNNLIIKNLWEAIETGRDFINESYSGNVKDDYFRFVAKYNESKLPEAVRKFHLEAECWTFSCAAGKNSVVGIDSWSGKIITEQDFQVLKRFAKVFEQAYTRFLDLQKAEAQAREATIEAALEKIRSRSLAMHRSNELKDVIAIIFEKLNELNILLGTVAIWLFNKATKDSIFWVGNNLQQPSLINLPYDEELMKEDTNYKDSWYAFLSGESYINKEYSEEEKNRYFRYVFAHNDLTAIPPEARDFLTKAKKYIACLLVEQNSSLYFDCWQGAIYSKESIQVFRRVAKVFEQAYIRFLDLQKAEALAIRAEQDLIEIKSARKKAEDTLTELRVTQAQLIQKEKMASLGELTAGIAHEIQNPLNFVNNFSEVNNELIDEMNNESDLSELKAIAAEIKQNNDKINFHGKRADAIVKGMLQHSRASTGEKQPTDINALADEYLLLSYQAMRSKDKAFQATVEKHFDESIGKINVVPQDIGRVLLNLYQNAFYAVNQRKQQAGETFEPLVFVSTKVRNGKAEIIVRDNGNGISQKHLDKIFQPFFTTKPTGQGTGLGLSLSYDIIKAHGGEIKVETKEGEYSKFIIELPFKSKKLSKISKN